MKQILGFLGALASIHCTGLNLPGASSGAGGGIDTDPHAECAITIVGTQCVCKDGYVRVGDTCTDIDECESNHGGCDTLTTCTNTDGSRECSACPDGYTGTGETGCVDVNECDTNNGACDMLVTCTNIAGSRTCGGCPDGYTGTGETGCVDINECDTNNGGCDVLVTCTNTEGGKTCGLCPEGYSGTGESLCVDIDECAIDHGNCDLLAECNNTPGAHTCGACPTGYTGSGATQCIDINECDTDNGNCPAHSTCNNTAGSFGCTCDTGYVRDGLTCITDPGAQSALDTQQIRTTNLNGNTIYTLAANVQGFSSSGTFTVPSGVTSLTAYVLGGGGGGGQGFAGRTGGGGGGAAQRTFVVTPGSTINFTVGSGGAGFATSGSVNGTNGGDSSVTIGDTTITGGGGTAGDAILNAGAGGIGVGGTINVNGGAGAGTAAEGSAGGRSSGVCSAGGGAGAIDADVINYLMGGKGGCYPAGVGGAGPPQWGTIPIGGMWGNGYYVQQPGHDGGTYGGGGGNGGNYNSNAGAGAGGYVQFSWNADTLSYVTNTYGVIATNAQTQFSTSGWTQTPNVTIQDDSNGGSIYYAVSFDNRASFNVNTNGTWRSIVRSVHTILDNHQNPIDNYPTLLWQYNSNATYNDTPTWTECTDNTLLGCIGEAMVISANHMTKAQLTGLTSPEWSATHGFVAGTFDIAIAMKTTDAANSPQFRSIDVTQSSP